MSQRYLLVTGLVLTFGACTYNEYHNTYNTLTTPDAGTSAAGSVGLGGTSAGGRAGVGGTGGGSAAGLGGESAGGAAGESAGGSAGAGSTDPDTTSCSGCVALEMPATPARALGLAFDDAQDLSDTLVSWRMRVRDSDAAVFTFFWVESGSAPLERIQRSNFTLTAESGWQTFGVDMAPVRAGNPDAAVSFDKSAVERIVFAIRTDQAQGVLTPVLVEIDFIRFSDHPALDRDFATDAGDLQLIDFQGEPTTGATLQHTPD